MNGKARHWILTIPEKEFNKETINDEFRDQHDIAFIVGQLESGEQSGFRHWQLCVSFGKQIRLAGVKKIFGRECHAEPTRSKAAETYCTKEETRIEGTLFSEGSRPFKRNSSTDWDRVKDLARAGNFDDIPSDIYVCRYGNLKRIFVDHCRPPAVERTVTVFYGESGTGKTRTAYAEAGDVDVFWKDPLTKFWCGYHGQKNVIIDEFRGIVSVAHLLRWLDRYPVSIEVKCSSYPLIAENVWITSNLPPSEWYPNLDRKSVKAIMRRLTTIKEFCEDGTIVVHKEKVIQSE